MPNVSCARRVRIMEDGRIHVPLEEIPGRGMVEVMAGRERLVLCCLDGLLFAVQATCPHRHGPLVEGELAGALLRCPWHGAGFDVRTGDWVRGPACADLECFETELVDGGVLISPTTRASEHDTAIRRGECSAGGRP